MGRKSKKRRFYPEFYSDDEYKDMVKRNNVQSRGNIPEPDDESAPIAEGAEEVRKTDYSEQELSNIYSRLNGTESGSIPVRRNKKLDIKLEDFKSDFIEENKKFSPLSPENPLKAMELNPGAEEQPDIQPEPVRIEQPMRESEPENGGYIQYNEPEETEAYTDIEESDNMDNFSDHYIAPGENIEEDFPEFADSSEALETMERVSSPSMDIPPVVFAPVIPEEKAENIPFEIAANPPDAAVKPYNREAAVRYAHRWALDRNAEYYDYDEIGGDCTNYASQVLLAGGCVMDFTPTTGWYYKSGNLKSPSWTGVEQLYNFLVKEKVAGPVGREVDISEVEPGDLINLSFNGKTYQHCPVIVKVKKTAGTAVSPKDIFICAHSYDCENRPLDTYTWKKMRFIKIVGTK